MFEFLTPLIAFLLTLNFQFVAPANKIYSNPTTPEILISTPSPFLENNDWSKTFTNINNSETRTHEEEQKGQQFNQDKTEAYNVKSEKVVGEVALVVIENSKALESCEQSPEVCNKTKPEKPITLTPTPTPSPTPTIVIPITIDPKPTIPVEPIIPPPADEPPVTNPCGCREDTKTGVRCIMLEKPCYILE